MRAIRVEQGDLTAGACDVLVNASNTEVSLGTGVSAAIRRACGPRFQEKISAALQSSYSGSMQPGDVLMTDAGTHPKARWVAHVAVMDYRGGHSPFPSLATVERGCRNLWEAIEKLSEPATVAMVALGAGVGGVDLGQSVDASCRTLKEHLGARPKSRIAGVTFFGFREEEHRTTEEVVRRHFPEGSA